VTHFGRQLRQGLVFLEGVGLTGWHAASPVAAGVAWTVSPRDLSECQLFHQLPHLLRGTKGGIVSWWGACQHG
jgi:hypothetical protein